MTHKKKDFYSLFDAMCRQEHPFVFFRLPNTKEIILYQQNSDKHYQSKELTEEGFVFAPFHGTTLHTYIPNQQQRKLSIPNTIFKKDDQTNNTEQLKESYLELVRTAKNQIQETALQKVVVSRKHTTTLSGTSGEAFGRLIAAYPDAMVYYWSHPKTGDWIGATPETLLHVQQKTLHTMALAGTLPYLPENQPKWTNKEIEEQSMVVDFIYERLQSIFPKSSIALSDTYTKRAGNIIHLCADFRVPVGDIKTLELVRLLHPTPAVAGLPMEDSVQFITQNESHERSFYAGFLGPIGKESAKLYVNLRCAAVSPNEFTLYVGGGITADSAPQAEWQESQRKAETLLRVL